MKWRFGKIRISRSEVQISPLAIKINDLADHPKLRGGLSLTLVSRRRGLTADFSHGAVGIRLKFQGIIEKP